MEPRLPCGLVMLAASGTPTVGLEDSGANSHTEPIDQPTRHVTVVEDVELAAPLSVHGLPQAVEPPKDLGSFGAWSEVNATVEPCQARWPATSKPAER